MFEIFKVRNNLSRIIRTTIQDIFYSNVNFYISLDIIQFHKLRISFLNRNYPSEKLASNEETCRNESKISARLLETINQPTINPTDL